MGKSLRISVIIAICASFLLIGGLPGAADSTLEETKKLLQKGLTLAELDQEIARLSVREVKLGDDIVKTEEQIAANQSQVAETRQHAAKVLRAYYMGERDNLWMLLFTAKSLSEALTIYEYLNMIIDNDHHSLNAYSDSFKVLVDAKQKLVDERQELQDTKNAFIAQREKAAAVQRDIEETIRASADAEALRAELDRFTNEWKEKGIPLFRRYLSSISGAMQGLPELLTGKNAEKYITDIDLLKKTMAFSIADADLTEFFRSKNPIFENITFQFVDDSFKAFGKEDGIEVSITGRYIVEAAPVNRLLFRVDGLTYNGFVLPETSNRALEQEFDLGFTPSKYVSGIEVTEVTMKGGKLGLKLKQK
jgi:hypothetical protein